MYHNSSTTYVMHNNSLPSPDYTGDSDSETEIAQELTQKRRQLDEEVARFRAQKDKEFREFVVELKSRRRRNKVQQQFLRNNNSYYHEFTNNSPSATPPASSSSMLNGFEQKISSPDVHSYPRQTEPIRLMKSSAESKVTPPTICLDKISIIGENVPHPHITPLQTPPAQNPVSQLAARASPVIHARTPSIDSTSPRNKSPKFPEEPRNRDHLTGLFSSTYLPVHSGGQIEGVQTEPASPTGHYVAIDSIPITSSSLPTESSMSTELQVPATKRAYTSPSTINRKALPPIIRNVNGRRRAGGKRKHVTFQLADRAIVEPSSSYEEGPSPDVDDDSDPMGSDESGLVQQVADSQSVESVRPSISRKLTPLDPFGRRKRNIVPEETPESEVGMNMGDLLFGTDKELHQSSPPIVTTTNSYNRRPSQQEDSPPADGYFSPRHDILSPTSPSPEKSTAFGSVDDNAYMNKQRNKIIHQRTERKNSRSPLASPAVSRQTSVDDGPANETVQAASKRLDSPHFSPRHSPGHSPRQAPVRQARPPRLAPSHRAAFIEDDLLGVPNNTGFFELDEELDSPPSSRTHFIDEDREETAAQESQARIGRHHHGLPEDIQTGTSVPINIARPGTSSVSNSWIGTFGH